MAKICKDYHQIYLESLDNPKDAAKAYDKMAVKLFGKNAMTNFGKKK